MARAARKADIGLVVVYRVSRDTDRELTIVRLRGEVTSETRRVPTDAVLACLAEGPRAIVVDLHGLTDRTGTAATDFIALHARGEREFGVPLLWTAGPEDESAVAEVSADEPYWPGGGTVLAPGPGLAPLAQPVTGSVGSARGPQPANWRELLGVYQSVAKAMVVAAQVQLPRQRIVALLPSDVMTPSHAGVLIADACAAWGLPDFSHVVRRVTFELVHNAVTHAGTDLQISANRRAAYLYLAVRDGSTQPPRMIQSLRDDPGAPLAPRGTGLRLVAGNSSSWGSYLRDDGKVVWATLQVRPPLARAGPHRPSLFR